MTQDELKALFFYDPETGIFIRRKWRSSNALPGSPAGSVQNKGYIVIWVDGRRYMAHRLAWVYVYGEWPDKQVDHINGVKSDNRIANLRLASNAENQQNLKPTSANKSGVIGVMWHKAANKWQASIVVERKTIHLGLFSHFDDAVEARYNAEKRHHTHSPARALKGGT